MNNREAFERYWLKVTCGTDAAVWDEDEGEYEDEDHQLAYQHFRFGWQSAIDQIDRDPVAYRRVSWDSNEWIYTSDKPTEELAWQPLYDRLSKPLND